MRLFFATDIHGSDKCFRKFLNCHSFYKADILIIGGDITGKAIVPIIEGSDGTYRATFMGIEEVARSNKELENLEGRISSVGYYPYKTTLESWKDISSNPEKMDNLFETLMKERLLKWLRLADEKLKGLDVRCFIIPGNDDSYAIDEVFGASETVVNPEGRVVELDETHEMLAIGNSNITPWNCPRDISEEKLLERMESLVAQIKDVREAIFSIHCPPFDSQLDIAQRLDENLRPVLVGRETTLPVGSKAVRQAIEKHQPLLGLHGHIHESRAYTRIGRTLCLNPGSEYLEGILRGALIELEGGRIKRFQFTVG